MASCRVVAWEPVPKFRHFIELGMQLNHFQAQVLVRPTAVADQDGGSYTLKVPQRGIWGTASIGGGNIDAYAPQLSSALTKVLLLPTACASFRSRVVGALQGHRQ